MIEAASDGTSASVSYTDFGRHGIARKSVLFGLRLLDRLGFVRIEIGPRRANAFTLLDDRRALDADEAARRVNLAREPLPRRAANVVPPKPVKGEPRSHRSA